MATKNIKAKKEALRGKERLQQLMEEFPEATWRQVVSTDMTREGLGLNETLRQVGRWALPDAPSYFERNKEGLFKSSEKTEGGYYLNPFTFYFEDGARWEFNLDSRSPYQVRYEERGRYRLYRDGEALEEVFFPPRPQWYDKKTSSGRPMASVISQRAEDALKLAAMTYCEYFKDGNGCRYCNINPAEVVAKEAGMERQTAKREQDVYETMLAACLESPQRNMVISGGVILDPSKEADMYARLVKAVRRAEAEAGYEKPIPLVVKCQAMGPKDQMKIKEAGASGIGFNLEVWDPKLFEWLCPGKTKYVGREQWIERILQAVEIWGTTSISFVSGVEMAPPHGFKSEDEGAASYLEGIEWLLAHGASPGGQLWRPAPGTMFEGQEGCRTEYLLRIRLGRQKLYAKYNKPFSNAF